MTKDPTSIKSHVFKSQKEAEKASDKDKGFNAILEQENQKLVPVNCPLMRNTENSNASKTVTIMDSWISCDLCKKWPLLPPGTDPTQFNGKTWRCQMQAWLPELNKCDFMESVTTKAFFKFYQITPPECDVDSNGQNEVALSQSDELSLAKKENSASEIFGNNDRDSKSKSKRVSNHNDIRLFKISKTEGPSKDWQKCKANVDIPSSLKRKRGEDPKELCTLSDARSIKIFSKCEIYGLIECSGKRMKGTTASVQGKSLKGEETLSKNLQGFCQKKDTTVPSLPKKIQRLQVDRSRSDGCSIDVPKLVRIKKSENLISLCLGKKDGNTAAITQVKEATDLMERALRLKKRGLELESNDLYFEAGLKFLQGASLLEASSLENTNHGDATETIRIYADTSCTFENCAYMYEKCNLMAAAALSYKCAEVCYMKIGYFKHASANKDHHDLRTTLQKNSTSSSTSDIDNIDIPVALDNACNRSKVLELLNYADGLNRAFEAGKKSQKAIKSAINSMANIKDDEMSTVNQVLNFNFHNIREFLRLVRISKEVIEQLNDDMQ